MGGLFLAASWAVIGLVLCVTIIGIPFGIQSFKMAKLALWPFGSQIRG
ncbi:YccF domain-containing protein [Bifidobacterium catenulatum]